MMSASIDDDDDLFEVRQVAPGRLIVFFLIFFVIGEGLRWFAKNYVRRKPQPLVLDLAATFTLYGYTVGCNYVHRIYGPTWYLMATASVGVGHALLLCPGVTANPVTHVVSCIACDTPIQKFLLRFAVHATGSLVSHPLATLLWQTLMADLSCEGLDPEMHCMGGHEGKGQSVHVAVVLGMELIGTLVVSLMMMKTCQLSIGIYETIAKVFIGGLLHCSGKNIPAIYLNPVLANAQLLGCSDQHIMEHVMVYWIGPLVGASVAVYSTFCNQETQRKLCRPCVTFDECPPSTESSQPCRPSDNDTKCGICDSKSRSNSSRPCRCLCDDGDDVVEGECCEEDVEPSACRPSGCGITAQVRQTTTINGSKQLAYLFDIPPTVCRKGLRLRHNILVTKKKPKCESDLCCDSWKDSTDSDWRNCCPFPTSPECQSEDWRRSCYERRDRSCSPEPEGDCMNHSLSRGPSRVKKPQRRSSTHRKHSEHARDSVRKSHSRKSSPRASEGRESPRRRHSRPSKKSHSHLDHHTSTKASRHSHAGTNLDHNKSLANTKSQAKAKPSKMSRADVTHHNKPSASATRPAGERTRSKV